TRRERKEAEGILTLLDIHDLRDRRIGRLSGGQTQRVFVAKALIGKPELLVLDEPTSGMDAQSRREFYLMLVHLNRDLGITLILTSHEVHSVTKLASRIAFLSGALLFAADPVAFERHPAHIALAHFPEAVLTRP